MTESPRDEIDLQELAVRLIRSFKRHYRLFLISAIGGIALAAGIWKFQPQVFESQMIMVSDILTRPYGDHIEQNFNNLIREGNTRALSEQLGLDALASAQLVQFTIECIPEVKSRERTKDVEIIKEQTYFKVKVRTKDFHVWPGLQAGLIRFLNNNSYVQSIVNQRTEINTALIAKIDDQLKEMDLLKNGLAKKETTDHKDQSKELMEASSLYTEYVHLNKMKLEYQASLENIQLVEGFMALEQPVGPKLSRYLLTGFVLGLGAAIGFLILRRLIQMAST